MSTSKTLALAAAVLLCASGCVAYKNVALHHVRTVDTKTGRETRIVAEPFLAFREVIERSPNVKSVTKMTDLKGEREPSFFAVSPTGESLVYQALEMKARPTFINLWKISTAGGTASTRLTAGRYLDMEPAFSPDGTNICFVSNRSSGQPKIWRIKASGAGGITLITQADSEDRWPCYLANGKEIHFASRPFNAEDWQVWRIGAQGSLPTQLKEGTWPRTSPDGKKLLYCSKDMDHRRWKIWVMDVDGTNQTQLTSDTKSDDWHPSWSPDGSKIVYATNIGKDSNGKRNFDIWVMGADGANQTQLTTNGSTDFVPRYSTDGKYIYFLSNRGYFWEIWRMEVAGG